MLRFEREYFDISFPFSKISFSNLLMTDYPEELTLSTFQKLFKLSRNVSVSSPFSSTSQRMEGVSKVREHENYYSLEMGQLDLLLT